MLLSKLANAASFKANEGCVTVAYLSIAKSLCDMEGCTWEWVAA